ncbi:glycosyl transferase, group 2 family protein [Brevundimonas sp. BAL3]|uniref:glycosyltransferase family 2 protein n=1 Tax=Brevundimonas sp. BAL3 TaxID=391600 RepID=UPI00017ECA6A|nr:glycosyltransferase family 2 protein [Brevundimonas sp. BAL3]EDX80183.1 glycosyl transferase, group 2 family protein [Brevundimonas sp. BAL3]
MISGSLGFWRETLAFGARQKRSMARMRRRILSQLGTATALTGRWTRTNRPSVIRPIVPREYFLLSEEALTALDQRLAALTARPLLSVVVPLYKTPYPLLRACLASLLDQAYPNFELILVDDAPAAPTGPLAEKLVNGDDRVRIIQPEVNGGISRATNLGVAAARGEFILFIDHDDELVPESLLSFVEHIVRHPEVDAWYSDQVTCDGAGKTLHHFFKPEWSPTYLLGVMYIGHLLAVRAEICAKTLFDSEFDGVQDFEFMLRVAEQTQRVGHVPGALYKWRATEGSLASGSDEKTGIDALQRLAVEKHLLRQGRTWRAVSSNRHRHRVLLKPGPRTVEPRISIIIPTCNQGEMIERCLDSIFAMTDYPDFEVIVVDNRTTEPRALKAFDRHPVKRVVFDQAFNYSAANNAGVTASNGEFLLFLNNDTEVLDTDWLSDLVMYFEDRQVGAVGPTLLYPARTVQHAGVVVGARGTADHVMRHFHEDWDGYAGSLVAAREASGVTAACLMMRRSLFDDIGGFSEDYAKHYQDVDLCLKIRERDLRILCVGQPRLIHYESATRKVEGYDLGDRALLIDRWHEVIARGDPYFNRALSLDRLDYSLADGVTP